ETLASSQVMRILNAHRLAEPKDAREQEAEQRMAHPVVLLPKRGAVAVEMPIALFDVLLMLVWNDDARGQGSGYDPCEHADQQQDQQPTARAARTQVIGGIHVRSPSARRIDAFR